uniref:Gnk2-homologous domain-containing protein n=1 Tax=Quercus lobata TaxID=97700 RepID=A0A7N2LUL2_QUELO
MIKMTSFFNPSLPILFLSILSFLSLTAHAADPYLLSYVCENTTFSASDSIYQSNLNSPLSSFSSNANVDFFATTRGSDTSEPVYGFFNCRGDLTSQDCRDCVNAAVKEITNNCSTQKVAIIWYDMCVLRYSNRSFFSTVDETPMFGLLNTLDVTDPNKFNQLLNASLIELLVELAKETSNVPTGANKFGTKQVTMTNFQTLYSLVQCTPDLYELYQFYETVATVPPPSPGLQPPSPGSVSGPRGTLEHEHQIPVDCLSFLIIS